MNAMFKKGMLASALAVVASSAMAASSVDIQVTGKIVPASCTPAFISGGGIADYGTIRVSSLNATSATPLADVKIIPISITCDEATRVAVTFNDAHADSGPTQALPTYFIDTEFGRQAYQTAGLGMYNDKKIGAYSLAIQMTKGAVTNDAGDELYPTSSRDNGATWATTGGERYLKVNTDKANYIPSVTLWAVRLSHKPRLTLTWVSPR